MSTVAPVTEAEAKNENKEFRTYHWVIIPRGSFTGIVITRVNSPDAPFPYEFADYVHGPCATYIEAAKYLRNRLEERAKAAEAALDQWSSWLDQYERSGGK